MKLPHLACLAHTTLRFDFDYVLHVRLLNGDDRRFAIAEGYLKGKRTEARSPSRMDAIAAESCDCEAAFARYEVKPGA